MIRQFPPSSHEPTVGPPTPADINMAIATNNPDADNYALIIFVSNTHAGIYRCNYCISSFTNQRDLVSHLAICPSKIEGFYCPGCFNYFTSRNCLEDHILEYHFFTHLGYITSSYFACNLCDYRTVSNLRIRSHVRKRINQESYICCVCFLHFSNKANLALHFNAFHQFPFLVFHSLQCSVCRRTFKSKLLFDLHIVFRHPDKDVMNYVTLCQWP